MSMCLGGVHGWQKGQGREDGQGREKGMLTRRGFLGRLAACLGVAVAAPVLLEALAPDPVMPVTITDQAEIAYSWSGGELFQVGDVITIEGRYVVNPLTYEPTRELQRFVVTSTATAHEIAAHPIILRPALIGPGSPYQNVSSAAPFLACDIRPDWFKPIEIDWSKQMTVEWAGLSAGG